jgi:alpha-L-fucosidase
MEMDNTKKHLSKVKLIKDDKTIEINVCETTPLVYKGRLLLLESIRPINFMGNKNDYYLVIKDVASNKEIARFGEGCSFGSGIIYKDTFYIFVSCLSEELAGPDFRSNSVWNNVTLLKSKDLKNWGRKLVIQQDEGEYLLNTSVCQDKEGFVMVYETSDPRYPPYSIKFAKSKDLENWTKVTDIVYGKDRYTACPCIRYIDGYYYMMYIEKVKTKGWHTYLSRSKDLNIWEPSPSNPVLSPGPNEGNNNSDPDIVEFEGKVYLYYFTGDQHTWGYLKRVIFNGGLHKFFKSFY